MSLGIVFRIKVIFFGLGKDGLADSRVLNFICYVHVGEEEES